MVTYVNRLGEVEVGNAYFAKLIGRAVSSCYGVAGMSPSRRQRIAGILGRDKTDSGIDVTGDINGINVEVRILVVYGMNIHAISQSIINKIKYTVFEAAGIPVDKVIVKITGIKE